MSHKTHKLEIQPKMAAKPLNRERVHVFDTIFDNESETNTTVSDKSARIRKFIKKACFIAVVGTLAIIWAGCTIYWIVQLYFLLYEEEAENAENDAVETMSEDFRL